MINKNKKYMESYGGGFEGQVAVVTGAAHGIGYEIASQFAAKGAKVVMADIQEEVLSDAAKMLREKHSADVIAFSGDLSDEKNAEKLRKKTEELGTVSILVNNAGGGVIKPFLEHTSETLKATIDRNLWTAIWCCKVFIPEMVASGYGRVIQVGADSVRNGLWQHAAYNAAKGGVHGLTTGLAREFAESGITVNTVAPCAVQTAALDHVKKVDPEFADQVLSVIPIGRAAEVFEVASMIIYLSGRDAAFITGQVISVNGGSTML